MVGPVLGAENWPEVGVRKGNEAQLIAGVLGRAAGGFGRALVLELVWRRRRSLWWLPWSPLLLLYLCRVSLAGLAAWCVRRILCQQHCSASHSAAALLLLPMDYFSSSS